MAEKVFLTFVEHATHTKNLYGINLARKNGVIMLSLPAHTKHRLQHLDVSFFNPLSTYFNQVSCKRMRSNPECSITHFAVSELLCDAYGKVATVGNAVDEFARGDVWPGMCFRNSMVFQLWVMQLRQP
jgi:hypothetical protein